MIERLYVHNYRCLENFTLDLKGKGSALLIGKNGSGKSTVRQALTLLQSIARGPNRVPAWVYGSDFTQQRWTVPMKFAIDLYLHGARFEYSVAFVKHGQQLPVIVTESLAVDGSSVFNRQNDVVDFPNGTAFGLDPALAALLVLRDREQPSRVRQLRDYLASMLLLSPVPAHMTGDAGGLPVLSESASTFVPWLNALILRTPAAFGEVQSYLRHVMPDFETFENEQRDDRGVRLYIQFKKETSGRQLSVEFGKLSDGEKCFFLSAVVTAYAKYAAPVFCFWDEPDNHLALSEVSHFVTALRRMVNRGGQFVATSHHPEAIRRFSTENTYVLTRDSHLEPTRIRPLGEFTYHGDLINALIRDEVIG